MSTNTPPPEDAIGRAARLRAMNERVRRIRDDFEGGMARTHAVMCECIDPACSEMLQLTGADVTTARAHADGFIVAPVHASNAAEVLDERDAFAVVRFA